MYKYDSVQILRTNMRKPWLLRGLWNWHMINNNIQHTHAHTHTHTHTHTDNIEIWFQSYRKLPPKKLL